MQPSSVNWHFSCRKEAVWRRADLRLGRYISENCGEYTLYAGSEKLLACTPLAISTSYHSLRGWGAYMKGANNRNLSVLTGFNSV